MGEALEDARVEWGSRRGTWGTRVCAERRGRTRLVAAIYGCVCGEPWRVRAARLLGGACVWGAVRVGCVRVGVRGGGGGENGKEC